jgi:acetyltransferase-like isoleucine patch superfamily enzyme
MFEIVFKIMHNIKNIWGILRGIIFFHTVCFVSRKAILSGNISIDKNSKISDYVKMQTPTVIKGKSIKIGKNCFINSFTCLFGEIEIGNDVLIGPNVSIIALDHDYSDHIIKNKIYIFNKIKIEENVWVGANSVILKGVTIGKGSIVGAGSVVTHSVPENVIVVGNPAKIFKKRVD